MRSNKLLRPGLISVLMVATALAATPTLAQKIYKTVDDKGNVTYTDQPPPQERREKVELPPVNQMPAQRVTRKVVPQSDTEGYSIFEIQSPKNDAVIEHEQLEIIVQLNMQPVLQEGHLVQFIYNGIAQGVPVASTRYAIGDLERGTYSISANIVDQGGRVLLQASPVTVHVQRQIVRPKPQVAPK